MDNINQFSLETVSVIDFGAFTLTLISSAFLGFILSWHYNKYFPYVSRSQGLGKTLVALAIITTVVITVVKSSLALSLGLVGALSIVRFRTPIKEPYELAYIFSSIAIGLGLGANQVAITFLGLFVLLLAMTYMSRGQHNSPESAFFIYISLPAITSSSKVLEDIKRISIELNKTIDVRRLDTNSNDTQVTLNVRLKNLEDLELISNCLQKEFPESEISIVDGQRLMPM